MRKERDVASRLEVIEIHKRLEQLVTKYDDGRCAYTDGASDQTIADDLKVSVNSVSSLRTAIFGKLRLRSEPCDPRVNDCIKLIENLQRSYDELKVKHNRLCAQLAVNRVADVRHLEIRPPPGNGAADS